MVLTNFECWAHGEVDAGNFETLPAAHNSPVMDPFNARVVSHIATSSNGYYGYAIVNSSNSTTIADNNNNSCNNNNIQQAMQTQSSDVDVATSPARCKKRCYVTSNKQMDMEMDNSKAVKRCRFDDADLVAQYCNDFFSLPVTQAIGTQACLMDYDCEMQQPQPQTPLQSQQQQQQLEQQQHHQHPRIHQHYQGGKQQQEEQHLQQRLEKLSNNDLESKNDIVLDDKCLTNLTADLYIATHGGCLHHFRPPSLWRSVESDDEFDI